jgi:hypothetical protein
MKKNIFIIFIAATLSLGMSRGVSLAHADTNADCDLLTSNFAALAAIQNNPNLTATQELNQELDIRKQLLGQTISCAKNDAQTLQTTLSSVTIDGAGATIQSQLSDKINDTINFYNIESTKLDGAGIASSEAIAKDVIAWRTANYEPLAGQVNDLLLWSQNQSLFQTAASRVTQTGQLVAFIESATPNNDLQSSFNLAQTAFQTAESDNNQAETSLSQFLPPDQSLATITQSLQSLADAYQKLSALNVLLEKLLPTNSS